MYNTMWDGTDLIKLMPHAIGFFKIDDFPGVINNDRQAWIFEGGDLNPRPITKQEILERGGINVIADEAAELFDQHPDWLDFLQPSVKKNDLLNSIRRISQETSAGVSPTKAAAKNPSAKKA